VAINLSELSTLSSVGKVIPTTTNYMCSSSACTQPIYKRILDTGFSVPKRFKKAFSMIEVMSEHYNIHPKTIARFSFTVICVKRRLLDTPTSLLQLQPRSWKIRLVGRTTTSKDRDYNITDADDGEHVLFI